MFGNANVFGDALTAQMQATSPMAMAQMAMGLAAFSGQVQRIASGAVEVLDASTISLNEKVKEGKMEQTDADFSKGLRRQQAVAATQFQVGYYSLGPMAQ